MTRADRTRGVIALAFGALLALLLWQLLFRGWAHSFDTMLYARSLWGIARGELFNPVAGRHAFAVHAHLTSALLAPLTYVMPSALVLVLGQACAIAATVWLVLGEVQRDGERRVAWFAILLLGSPFFTNPFLFDARPDLIGVPLCLASMLRVRSQRRFDRLAIGYAVLGVLAREEFAFCIALTALIAPLEGPRAETLRTRIVGSVAPVAYWALYWFVGRRLLGGELAYDEAAASSIVLDAGVNAEGVWQLAALYKLEIAAMFVLTCGALVWREWRWLAVASPGLVLMLASNRMQELVLNFHYAMFALPGLLVASIEGYERYAPRFRQRVAPSLLIAVLCYAISSAVPFGGRFRPQNFSFGSVWLRRDVGEPAFPEQLAASHAALDDIPEDAPLAAPFALAAPNVDRRMIARIEHLEAGLVSPSALEWVAIFRESWPDLGRALVERHGFRLFGMAGTGLAVLHRGPGAIPWPATRFVASNAPCDAPLATWPTAGLALCGVERTMSRRVAATVGRVAPSAGSPLRLWLRTPRGAVELVSYGGILNPSQVERPVRFVPVTDVPFGTYELVLTDLERNPQGRAVPIEWRLPDAPEAR